MEYISASLILIVSAATNTIRTRRKQALRGINPSLVNELDNLCPEPDPTFLFGANSLKRLRELNNEQSQLDKLSKPPNAKRPRPSGQGNTSQNSNQFFRKGPIGGAGPVGRTSITVQTSIPNQAHTGATMLPGGSINSPRPLKRFMRPILAPPNAARLSFFLNNWLLIRPGPEIRHYVKGVQFDTTQNLYWTTPPHNCISTAEQRLAANQEIDRLLVMGAIETVEKTYFLNPIFLRLKTSGQWRLILNLKALNKHLNPPHFKMEGLHCIKYTVSQGNWLAKIDLKDAYLSVGIQKEFRKFLQFLWQGKTFQYRAMPFGLSIAPYVFTKLLSYLRSQGIKISYESPTNYHKDQISVSENSAQGQLLSQRTVSTDRIAELHQSSYPNSPFILPSPSVRPNINAPVVEQLQPTCPSFPIISGEHHLVDDKGGRLEFQPNSEARDKPR